MIHIHKEVADSFSQYRLKKKVNRRSSILETINASINFIGKITVQTLSKFSNNLRKPKPDKLIGHCSVD